MKHADQFFAYARERYAMLLRRRCFESPPWTRDPILAQYRFCNVFREDDIVTQWIKANIRDPLKGHKNLIPALCAARFINRVSSLTVINNLLIEGGWSAECVKRLKELKAHGQPIITGAYMVKAPTGKDKISGIDAILRPIQRDADRGGPCTITSLQTVHTLLMKYPYMGSFMAYEVVTDYRHTITPTDHMTWAAAGPGAARGLGRVFYGDVTRIKYSAAWQPEACKMMAELLTRANGDLSAWPVNYPSWEMRDVEHTLCEFDKYERARLGEGRPKQKYP